MTDAQLIDAGLLILTGLFCLLGIIFMVQGLFGGRSRSRYGVGRLRARRAAMSRFLQGVGLLVVALVVFGVWLRYQPGGAEPELEAVPTLLPTVAATEPPPTLTMTAETELPTPDVATEAAPTDEPLPEPTEAEVSAEPTEPPATAEPTEEPTPAPTDTPTKPPYDAEVRVVGGVNLRDSPNGNVLVLIEDGEGVFLLEGRERAGRYAWQKVRTLDGTDGWVAEQFLVIVE